MGEALIKNKLPVTVLRNNFFMNHLLKTDCDNIDKEGFFSNPLGDTRNSLVCTNDIAEAAFVVIQEGPSRHANKFYDITGPEPQSMHEIAADLCNGFYSRCSPDFYNLTGRRPTTYAEYLANKGAAGETGLEELYQANLWKKGEDAMKAAAEE